MHFQKSVKLIAVSKSERAAQLGFGKSPLFEFFKSQGLQNVTGHVAPGSVQAASEFLRYFHRQIHILTVSRKIGTVN